MDNLQQDVDLCQVCQGYDLRLSPDLWGSPLPNHSDEEIG